MELAIPIAAIVVPSATMGLFFVAINANLNGRINDFNARLDISDRRLDDVRENF